MASFARPLEIDFDGAIVKDHALSWVARDSSKPGRLQGERWVLHGSPDWSMQHLEDNEDSIIESLLGEFFDLTSTKQAPTIFHRAHRWRYARALQPLSARFIFDEEKRIGYCGDWCASDRVENAYLSGIALAEQIEKFASGGPQCGAK